MGIWGLRLRVKGYWGILGDVGVRCREELVEGSYRSTRRI